MEKEGVPIFLDIGTETVKAGSVIQYFDQFGVFDSRDFEKDVLKKAILKVLEASQSKKNLKEPPSFLISLPPEFLKARIVFKTHKRNNFKNNIDKIEEKEILQTVLEEVREIVSQDFAKISGILPQDSEFLNQEILEIKIDGYDVPHLQGYKGENLEFRTLSIFIPRHYLQNFEKILKDSGINNFKIVHLVQNHPNFFREKDAIFLDIGGEITQIFLARNGKLEGIDDFEMGGKDFSRVLSQHLGLTEEEARDLKERYSKGFLSEGSRKRIREIFSAISREWLSNFKSKLKNLKGLLPSTLFLFGGGSRLPEIEEVLTEGGYEVKWIK